MAEKHFEIETFSHNFKVTVLTGLGRDIIRRFGSQFIQYQFSRKRGESFRTIAAVYSTREGRSNVFRFHINQLPGFLEMIKGSFLDEDSYTITAHEPNLGVEVKLEVRPEWVLRPHQIEIPGFLNDPSETNQLVGIQTGKGKTVSALYSAAQVGRRTGIVVRAQFTSQWAQACLDTLKLKRKDVMVIKGGEALEKVLDLARKKKLKAKILIFSNKTLQAYLKAFEGNPELFVNLGHTHPQEIYPTLGIGLIINDEVHLDFHLNYCMYSYMHTGRSYALSATLIDDDQFMERMYSIVFPKKNRFGGGEYVKYVATTAVLWNLYTPQKIRTTEYGSTTYSHTAFEKSIAKHIPTLNNYMRLIDDVVNIGFVRHKDRQPGFRLLILVATIDFATRLTKFLREQHPDLDIRRYVDDDPYENLLEPDIRVSTILSSGTGHDIKKLFCTIMTTGVRSPKSNLQAFGRTREMSDGTTPRFYYMACKDIPKQMDYHFAKSELLKSRSASFYTDVLPRVV